MLKAPPVCCYQTDCTVKVIDSERTVQALVLQSFGTLCVSHLSVTDIVETKHNVKSLGV